MKINLHAFKQIVKIENDLWFSKNTITNTKKNKSTSIRYTPKETIFDREFGISDLSTFMSMLTMYPDPVISFNKNDLVISKSDFTGALTYRISSETAMRLKIDLAKNSNSAFNNCNDFLKTGSYFKFLIDENQMNEIISSAKFIKAKDADTFLRFEKDSTDDEIRLVVTSQGCENIATHTIKGENTASLGAFSAQLNIDTIPVSGSWEFYIFEGHNIIVRNSQGMEMSKAVKETFLYGRSNIGEDELLEWYSCYTTKKR